MSSLSNQFDEGRFTRQVNAALSRIRTVLENTRNPNLPSEVSHSYNDKYLLSELLVNSSLAAQLNCFEILGITSDILKKLKDWSTSRAVTLRFTAEENCKFIKTTTKEVESDTEYVTEVKGVFGTHKRTDKTVRTVTEHFWEFSASYSFTAYQGNNPKDNVLLCNRSGSCELITSSKNTPKSAVSIVDAKELNISWLLQNMNKELQIGFSIDRTKINCNTPRRNSDVESALAYFNNCSSWLNNVTSYFKNRLFPVQPKNDLDLSAINDNGIFIPVVPLFEEKSKNIVSSSPKNEEFLASIAPYGNDDSEGECVLLPLVDINKFLLEQKRSINEKLKELQKVFPTNEKLITYAETSIMVSMIHCQKISQYYFDGVNYIEQMLLKQLIAAIGKEVTPVDFSEYMLFHNRKLFKKEYEPKKFCYAIRRPEHYPEGILSIEAKNADGSISEPLCTMVNQIKNVTPMKFSINAATTISFTGERYLHAWINHQFSGYSGSNLSLVARARQFSCFILMIGNIVSADKFNPKQAIIIQNKDDLLIPLLLEQIPTPKAFRDSIESLSPEQQRFAKAFRSMQLESTLFGICIIQIKPQLEKLLNLPDDSLTKEIELTQDLLDLFITYQIPSDLISFSGNPNDSPKAKVDKVKQYVKAMQDMIAKSKEKEVKDAQQKAVYSNLNNFVFDDSSVVAQAGSMNVIQAKRFGRNVKSTHKSGIKTDDEEINETPSGVLDFTKLPIILDSNFSKFDIDSALHSTIIKPGQTWDKSFLKSLLSKPSKISMNLDQQKTERNKAFDLLDALSKSGILSVEEASFHVVLAATHSFDKTLIDTIIKDNINPIEKVERSSLIVGATIHEEDPEEMIKPDQLERVKKASPILF